MHRTTNSPLNYYSPVFHTTQEHRNESVSPARVTNVQLEQHNMKTKKKKCHGNRKEQHKRRRSRRHEEQQQQMDQSIIIENINDERVQVKFLICLLTRNMKCIITALI